MTPQVSREINRRHFPVSRPGNILCLASIHTEFKQCFKRFRSDYRADPEVTRSDMSSTRESPVAGLLTRSSRLVQHFVLRLWLLATLYQKRRPPEPPARLFHGPRGSNRRQSPKVWGTLADHHHPMPLNCLADSSSYGPSEQPARSNCQTAASSSGIVDDLDLPRSRVGNCCP